LQTGWPNSYFLNALACLRELATTRNVQDQTDAQFEWEIELENVNDIKA